VRRGTGSRALVLNRKDIAGMTGTSNDYGDAWFCGYTPAVVAVSWIGFPTPRNMGHGETGEMAALPIWINYMRAALANVPEAVLPRPPGIGGSLTGKGSQTDYYYSGNEPPESATPPLDEQQVRTVSSATNKPLKVRNAKKSARKSARKR
jgi:penicillin-binding protein 1A